MKVFKFFCLIISFAYALNLGAQDCNIYWINRGNRIIQRSNVAGLNIQTARPQPPTEFNSMFGIDIDGSNGKIYWSDGTNGRIRRADVDGSNEEELFTSFFSYDIDLDLKDGKVYFSDFSNNIRRSDLNGANLEIVINPVVNVRGITVDEKSRKLYWTESSTPGNGKIKQSNLDGTDQMDIITGLGFLSHLAIDTLRDKIYWTDEDQKSIRRANLNGSNIETLVTGLSLPTGITLDIIEEYMYWTDRGTGKIQRSQLDGSDVQDLVSSGQIQPWGIAISAQGCPIPPIAVVPTMSQWGMILLGLILIICNVISIQSNRSRDIPD